MDEWSSMVFTSNIAAKAPDKEMLIAHDRTRVSCRKDGYRCKMQLFCILDSTVAAIMFSDSFSGEGLGLEHA